MGERMDRKKEERRNRILDVAEGIVAEKGIGGLTLDDVAKEADIATGTLYLYFRNKNSLCAAVSVRLIKQMNAAMVERAEPYASGSDRARAYGTGVIEFAMEHPEKWKAIKQLLPLDYGDTGDENIRELLELENQSVHFMAQLYRDAIADGDLRPDVDPVPTAIFMRYSLAMAFDPLPRMRAVLQMNGISQEYWVTATRDLMAMATHLKAPGNRDAEVARPAKKKPGRAGH